MSFIGKIHEITFYGLITTIVCLLCEKISINNLCNAAFHSGDLLMLFQFYLFWASIFFVPIAIIGAYVTKHVDNGKGLTFNSVNVIVIMFAHIAEEFIGLFLTPGWFLRDLFLKRLNGWKIFDYVTYAIEITLILIGYIYI